MSLLHRLILLVCLALLPVGAVEVEGAFDRRHQREAEVRETAHRLLVLLQAEQARLIEGVWQVLITLARTDEVRSGDKAACRGLLSRLRADYPDHISLFVTDRAGVVVCSTDPDTLGNDISHRPHFRGAIADNGFASGGHIRRRDSGSPVLPFAVPYHDEAGQLAGTVTALVELSWLRRSLASQPLPDNTTVVVADSEGALIASVPELPDAVGRPLPERFQTLRTEPRVGMRDMAGIDGRDRILAYAPPVMSAVGLFISIGIDKEAAFEPLRHALLRSLGLTALVTLLTVAGIWWTGDRLLRKPVATLVDAARRWGAGDRSVRVAVRAPGTEIATLGQAFNAMADDLQRQAEERDALHALEQRMAAVLAATTDGVFEVDHGWRITFMNMQSRLMVSGGRDLTGLRLWDVYPEAEHSTFGDHYRTALAEQEPTEFEAYYPPLDAWFAVRAFPTGSGLAVFFQDVSARHRAEAERRRSESRFRAVFEQAAVGIVLVAADGRCLDANEKLCTILGQTRTELIGRPESAITDPVDQQAEAPLVQRLLDGTIPSYAIEKRYRRMDGRAVWVRVTSSLARGAHEEEPVRLCIVEDITGRMAMEAALRGAKDEAERANVAKTKFLAAASHDLRQPLQSLFFFVAALGAHVGKGDGRTVLMHIERGLDALKGLLDSLLDVSRLDAGMVTPSIEEFAIAELLDPLYAAYEPVATARGLRWTVDGAGVAVRSDRTLLSRLLRNLVENALRYTEVGEVALECSVEREALRITVRDTGIGIPADHLDRIFDEFHQVGNPERDRQQGLGLGLAIVRRISRLLDHPIEVESVAGRGSRFSVLVALGSVGSTAPAPASSSPLAGVGRLAVLVDDDAIVLMGLHAMLSDWGYDVVAAGDADQAMAELAAEDRRPDIVIADYRLRARRVGTEVILRVRERYGANVPGVILTGETGPECQQDAALHGLMVVHKPVTPRQLAAVLSRELSAAE